MDHRCTVLLPSSVWSGTLLGSSQDLYPTILAYWKALLALDRPALKPSYQFKSCWGKEGKGLGELAYPYALAISASDLVYIADSGNHRISVHEKDGKFVRAFGSQGPAEGQFNEPVDLVFDREGNLLVVDKGNSRIQKFDASGTFLSQFSCSNQGPHQGQAYGICLDNNGNILIANSRRDHIEVYTPEGVFSTAFNHEFVMPTGVAVNAQGEILVVDRGQHRLVVVDPSSGSSIRIIGKRGTLQNDNFYYPWAGVFSKGGEIIVGDAVNNRIKAFSNQGEFMFSLGKAGKGPGEFGDPYGLVLDWSGDLYIADVSNHRIQIWG